MSAFEISTQADLDRVLAEGDLLVLIGDGPYVVTSGEPVLIVKKGQPRVEARESSQPRVEARGSSQPCVEARESSQPRVVAWGSSQPHVVAWESSQPHVVAWGSSQPCVEAWGYTQLSVSGRCRVEASNSVAVLVLGTLPSVVGGQQTRFQITTPEEWCKYYGSPPPLGGWPGPRPSQKERAPRQHWWLEHLGALLTTLVALGLVSLAFALWFVVKGARS